ncbi:hypothetical protein BDW69DRAFT_123036 [Aspergillus filifer]
MVQPGVFQFPKNRVPQWPVSFVQQESQACKHDDDWPFPEFQCLKADSRLPDSYPSPQLGRPVPEEGLSGPAILTVHINLVPFIYVYEENVRSYHNQSFVFVLVLALDSGRLEESSLPTLQIKSPALLNSAQCHPEDPVEVPTLTRLDNHTRISIAGCCRFCTLVQIKPPSHVKRD